MKSFVLAAAIAVLTSPLSAQALNEPFETSITGNFPPTGWSLNMLPAHTSAETWEDTSLVNFTGHTAGSVTLTDAAGHDYTLAGMADNRLETPAMDLSSYGAPSLTYDGSLGYVNWMTHTSTYIGASYIDVSTDGGATWAAVWQEASVVDYNTLAIVEDLTAVAASQSSVIVGFRYEGDFAHEWGLDNVMVGNAGPIGPGLGLLGTCPGTVSANASGMTPAGPVVFARGFVGSFTVGGGACAGLVVGLSSPTILATVTADGAGNASLSGNAPAGACGTVVLVAVDVATCTGSNTIAL